MTAAGTLTLAGANSVSGGTTVANGAYTLRIGNGGTTGSLSGNVALGGRLHFNRSDVLTFSGDITTTGGGIGKVFKQGAP